MLFVKPFYVFGMKGVRVLVQNDGSWLSSKICGSNVFKTCSFGLVVVIVCLVRIMLCFGMILVVFRV